MNAEISRAKKEKKKHRSTDTSKTAETQKITEAMEKYKQV